MVFQKLHPDGFPFLSPGGAGLSLLYWSLYKEVCICSLAGCNWFNQLKYTSKDWMFL